MALPVHMPSSSIHHNLVSSGRSRCSLRSSCSIHRRNGRITHLTQPYGGFSCPGSCISRTAQHNSRCRGSIAMKAGDGDQKASLSVLVPEKTSTPVPPPGEGNEDGLGWQWFNLQLYAQRWNVPWDGKTVAGVMSLWALSFVVVGFFLVPGAYRYAGVELSTLGPEGRAGFTLISQVSWQKAREGTSCLQRLVVSVWCDFDRSTHSTLGTRFTRERERVHAAHWSSPGDCFRLASKVSTLASGKCTRYSSECQNSRYQSL